MEGRTQDALHVAGQHGACAARRRGDADAADLHGDAQREVALIGACEPDDLEHAVQQPDEALVPPARAPDNIHIRAWCKTSGHFLHPRNPVPGSE